MRNHTRSASSKSLDFLPPSTSHGLILSTHDEEEQPLESSPGMDFIHVSETPLLGLPLPCLFSEGLSRLALAEKSRAVIKSRSTSALTQLTTSTLPFGKSLLLAAKSAIA